MLNKFYHPQTVNFNFSALSIWILRFIDNFSVFIREKILIGPRLKVFIKIVYFIININRIRTLTYLFILLRSLKSLSYVISWVPITISYKFFQFQLLSNRPLYNIKTLFLKNVKTVKLWLKMELKVYIPFKTLKRH